MIKILNNTFKLKGGKSKSIKNRTANTRYKQFGYLA